ncbi:MAG TPA: hypothetical protein VMP08_09870 [Anaerolineae bacterium]|nr:hypothetical protein [Anaerolineae bacterium]
MNPQRVKWLIIAGLVVCVLLLLNLLSIAPVRVVASNLRQAVTDTPTPTPTPTTLTYHSITFDGSVNTTQEWSRSAEKLGTASGVQYYVTWDDTYLYVGMLGGNTNNNRYNLLLDTDPSHSDSSNTGTQNELCGATFGVKAKPDYAIQQIGVLSRPNLLKSATLTVTPTPTSCGNDCRLGGMPPQSAFTPTPDVHLSYDKPSQSLWSSPPAIWSTWTPSSSTSSHGATNQVEFRVRWSDIGLTGRGQPIGLYLYTCDSSNHVISAWPPSNRQAAGNVQELSSRTYFLSTDSGRAPRVYAQQWGEQTVLTATGNLSLLNGFAQFNITAGGGAGCSLTVNVRGNAATDRSNSAVRRLYDITPINCPDLTANLTLKYLDGSEYEAVDELNGAVEANLHLFHWNGSRWVDEGGTVNTISNTVTSNNVSSFSPWTFDDGSGPTAVTLTHLSAQHDTAHLVVFLIVGSVAVGGVAIVIKKRRRA